jgi:hypothetical protein
MISKTTLKQYDFNSLDDYFNMTLESKINGNFSQAENQFKKMDKIQKIEFIEFVRVNEPSEYTFFLKLI